MNFERWDIVDNWNESLISPPDVQRQVLIYKEGDFEELYQTLLRRGVVKEYSFTGSRMICSPPPRNTDRDIILLYDKIEIDFVHNVLQTLGWESCIKKCKDKHNYRSLSNWQAFRKGQDNVLITHDEKHFDLFLYSTKIAMIHNLTNKDDRIRLFESILYFKKSIAGVI